MLYSYKIVRDFGFAPNPFHQICTLANCKPDIRERCNIGDWIAGFGGLNTIVAKKLVFLMEVNEKLTFDEYWDNQKFIKKRPCFNKKIEYSYGDNIYHHNSKEWVQENSHHSSSTGINYVNLNHDTRVNQIAISYNYWYFGKNAISLPEELLNVVPNCRNYIKIRSDNLIQPLIDWMENNFEKGQYGLPFSWNEKNLFERYKGENKKLKINMHNENN